MRNPAIALGAATLAVVIFVALILLSQVSQVQADVDALAASSQGDTAVGEVLDDLRALDSRIDALNGRLDEMAGRFDRLDASIAQLPTETENRTQIGAILDEVQALQGLLDGLSLDLGIVCDVLGC